MSIKTPKLISILKRTVFVLLFLVLLLSAWVAFAIYHDESPDIG